MPRRNDLLVNQRKIDGASPKKELHSQSQKKEDICGRELTSECKHFRRYGSFNILVPKCFRIRIRIRIYLNSFVPKYRYKFKNYILYN